MARKGKAPEHLSPKALDGMLKFLEAIRKWRAERIRATWEKYWTAVANATLRDKEEKEKARSKRKRPAK